MLLKEFLEYVSDSSPELFLITGTDIILFDRATGTVYIPGSARNNTELNRFAEYGTGPGHAILWSRQRELACTSDELSAALIGMGYIVELYALEGEYQVYILKRQGF